MSDVTRPDYNKWMDPSSRAAAVLEALQNNTGTVQLDAGVIDFGSLHAFKFPDTGKPVKVIGAGIDQTIIKCGYGNSTFDSKHEGLTIGLANNLTLENMTLDARCPINVQGVGVGFDNNGKADVATLNNVKILATCWGLYSWSNDSDTINLNNCQISAGRQCISLCGSGSKNGVFINATNCMINLDSTLSTYQGAVTHPVYGGALAITQRCGTLITNNCKIQVKGIPGLRAVGYTDCYDDGRIDCTCTHTNIDIQITPNGAREAYDVDVRRNKVMMSGGLGSGMALMSPISNGALMLSKSVGSMNRALVAQCKPDPIIDAAGKVTGNLQAQIVWIAG